MNNFNEYKQQFFIACQKKGLTEDFYFRCIAYAQRLSNKSLPIIYDYKHLSLLVGYDVYYLFAVSNASSKFYTHFSIDKKNGGKRNISAPYPSLLEIQRWILDNILEKLPISIYAKAYRKGFSILDNARFHRKQKKVLHLDIKDFFPSIKAVSVYNIFRNAGYSKSLARLFSGICTLNGALPQGAPTSPALSNIFFYPIDARIGGYIRRRGIRYSRYADDMTFSGDLNIKEIIHFIEKLLSEYNLQINKNKTSIMRQENRQVVTGIVTNKTLNSPKNITRELIQCAYYINKYGLYEHMKHKNITDYNYIYKLLGKAYHIKFINPKTYKIDWIISVLKNYICK